MFQHAAPAAVLLLAQDLFKNELSSGFYMAGGTALALHLGHRKSVDIDIFCEKFFSENQIKEAILQKEDSVLIQQEEGTLHCMIKNIKVSVFHYPYPVLNSFVKVEDISLASIEDIACMKVVSISQRAEKKDFFDLYEVCKKISPLELKKLFVKKYGENKVNCYHVLRSFFFFSDVENSPDPISLNGTTWEKVKSFFKENEKTFTSALLC
jgi:hypothetical protein